MNTKCDYKGCRKNWDHPIVIDSREGVKHVHYFCYTHYGALLTELKLFNIYIEERGGSQ